VYENIASPLRLASKTAAEIKQRVESVAETLRLTPYLDRYPTQLSGGQQQRTALARALAKDADLVLLDEPLVNLDYKLREELREELSQLFAARGTTVVYATTEPQEALQLGGHIAVLREGRLLQHGPTLDSFKRPPTLEIARAFSDPPLNELPVRCTGDAVLLDDGMRLPLPPQAFRREGGLPERMVLGIRAHQFDLLPRTADFASISGRVELAEIGGSETYVHLSRPGLSLTAQLPGVHDVALGQTFTLHIDPSTFYGFDTAGRLLFSPNFDKPSV
jgi:glycerol transport system ATP-binding protein